MQSFPAFIPLAGRRVAIVGDGEAADAKVRLFDGSPAEIVPLPETPAALDPSTYAGMTIVFVAVEDLAFAQAAAQAAREAGALVNVVDRPHLSDFATPAIVDRGSVMAAIGTSGAAPVLATRLREELEARWPAGLGGLAELLLRLRDAVRERFPEPSPRRAALRRLLDGEAAKAALGGDLERACDLAVQELAAEGHGAGRVRFLTCPPTDDLLTLRSLRALSSADRLITAPDVRLDMLRLARRDAPVELFTSAVRLVELAGDGLTVVCLTGAPAPNLIEAVRAAGADVELLP
jgi:precorrin-2 dehydrogenase/sirohydrochlorin ferrochelatase